MGTALQPIELPDWAWERAEVRQALRARDVGAVFRHVQQYAGASQARIAAAAGMTRARVNEIINGRREVSRLDVYERIAEGLRMPDDARHLLGLAASRERRSGGAAFDVAAFPEVVRVYATQHSAADEIQQQAREAQELDVLAVRGLGLIGLNDSLRAPACRASRAAKASGCGCCSSTPTVTPWLNGRPRSGSLLSPLPGACGWRRRGCGSWPIPATSRVYRYRMLPTWRLTRTDSTMFVSAFDAGWEGHESATYKVMETPHGPLYRGLLQDVRRGHRRRTAHSPNGRGTA